MLVNIRNKTNIYIQVFIYFDVIQGVPKNYSKLLNCCIVRTSMSGTKLNPRVDKLLAKYLLSKYIYIHNEVFYVRQNELKPHARERNGIAYLACVQAYG